MSYGIEIRNTDGNLVIDEENEVILVAEKHTISGTRSSPPLLNGSPSLKGDFEFQWWNSGENWYCCVHLDNSYSDPPLIGLRGANGNYNVMLPGVRMFQSTETPGDPIDRLTFRSEYPYAIDFIVCAGASDCPSSSKVVGTTEYGLEIKNSAATVIFDSRWPAIVSCTEASIFPAGVDVNITFDSQIPIPFNTQVNKTGQTVTIPSTPAAFIVTTGLSGVKSFYYGTSSGQGGEPVENYGGGIFHPTFIQTSDTSLTATCYQVLDGLPGTPGQQYVDIEYTGPFQVLRYLDF